MKPIQFTEPFLPPLEEYIAYLRGVWDRNWLTNQGPLMEQLEQKLKAYHQLPSPVHCVANGGLGLQILVKALGVRGEIITTPFSYVATASCPLWEGCTLNFADIEPDFLTIDPKAVESAITSRTEAILGTHVFGCPCDVEALAAIARKHRLALIFDAAHAFGVFYQGKSLLDWGDASMVSLHATKLFHTVEGGFLVARDSAVSEKIEWMRRFGHHGSDDFHGVGINAKMSEFHAAMGLSIFDHIQEIFQSRRVICDAYDIAFTHCPNVVEPVPVRNGTTRNYSYYPVLFKDVELLSRCLDAMKSAGIFPRRYFYPCLNTVTSLGRGKHCAIAEDVARRILCLPLAANMLEEDVSRVADIVHQIKE